MGQSGRSKGIFSYQPGQAWSRQRKAEKHKSENTFTGGPHCSEPRVFGAEETFSSDFGTNTQGKIFLNLFIIKVKHYNEKEYLKKCKRRRKKGKKRDNNLPFTKEPPLML